MELAQALIATARKCFGKHRPIVKSLGQLARATNPTSQLRCVKSFGKLEHWQVNCVKCGRACVRPRSLIDIYIYMLAYGCAFGRPTPQNRWFSFLLPFEQKTEVPSKEHTHMYIYIYIHIFIYIYTHSHPHIYIYIYPDTRNNSCNSLPLWRHEIIKAALHEPLQVATTCVSGGMRSSK